MPRGPAMIVCVCYRVSDRDIRQAVHDGVRDFEALQDETSCSRGCGCCRETAEAVFQQACATITLQRAAGDAPALPKAA